MFRLSRGGEYALHALISLAAKEGDGYTLLSELAKLDGAAPKYLAKIFQKLVKARILRSSRGVGGGFALAKPSDEITVAEVIEAIEGPFELTRCRQCEKYETCGLYKVWSGVEYSMQNALSEITISQLRRGPDSGRRSRGLRNPNGSVS